MALTASPFDATTGQLLPVYRDAYLRGDLSQEHTLLVDAYLKKHAALGDQTWERFHVMQQDGQNVQAVGWVQRQLDLLQTQPQRFRRRAASVGTVAALIGGAVFAGTNLPSTPTVMVEVNDVVTAAPAEAAASSMRFVTVRGRILDENGRPLVGATVLEKGSYRGVSTNGQGEYSMLIPAGHKTTLSYDYGGYTGEEIAVSEGKTANVTLVPSDAPTKPAKKAKRWWLF